ncbi:MAG: hypothetical protein ACM3OB_10950 [Acidobacteriota bacterium]
METPPTALRSLLTHRYFVRLHMGLMLGGVILSGVWASVLLRWAGLPNPALRYPLAVAVSYCVFFGLIRLWLFYVERTSPSGRQSRGLDLSGLGNSGGISWGGSSGASGSDIGGRGGSFGGGGASTGFEEANVAPQPVALPLSSSSPAARPSGSGQSGGSGHSGRSGGSGGGSGDGLGILIALAVLVAAICGAGIYLVYQAPVILSEAAFHAALLPGLVKVARGAHDESWERSVLGSTWIPFILVLALAAILGGVMRHNCPDAVTLHQALSDCVSP